MTLKIAAFLCLSMCFASVASGQTTRDADPTPPSPTYQSSKKEVKKKGLFKRLFSKEEVVFKTAEEESIAFRKRMAKNRKAKSKIEKKSLAPQYSDPLYFGHKKPPKKRKNGKKKFCKECGLRH